MDKQIFFGWSAGLLHGVQDSTRWGVYPSGPEPPQETPWHWQQILFYFENQLHNIIIQIFGYMEYHGLLLWVVPEKIHTPPRRKFLEGRKNCF